MPSPEVHAHYNAKKLLKVTEDQRNRGTSPLEKRKEKILALIRENRHITLVQLAKELGVSKSTVTRAIRILEEENRLKRHGTKGGHWEILQERDKLPFHNDPSEEITETIWVKVTPDGAPEEITESAWIKMTQVEEEPSSYNDPSEEITESNREKVTQENDVKPSPYKDPLEKIKEAIWWAMRGNRQITRAQLAEQTGEPISRVDRAIAILKEEGRVKRVGTNRFGHWETLQPGEKSSGLSLKDERKEKILSLTKANHYITPITLARETGVSVSTISKDIAELKAEGQLEEDKPRRSISPEEIVEAIQEMMRENSQITRAQLAQKTGALISTVDKAIAIPIKETIWKLTEEDPFITIAQLAQRMSVEMPTVEIPTVTAAIDILKEEKGVVRSRTRGEFWKRLKEGEKPPHYDTPEEREEKVLLLIRENRHITAAQIAKKLDSPKRIIDQTIARLKKKGRLKRHGTKGRFWEIPPDRKGRN